MKTTSIQPKLPVILLIIFFAYSCTSDREKAIERITIQEQALLTDTVKVLNPEKGAAMMAAYADFVKQFPGDSLCPDYLFKAADIAQGLHHDKLALGYYTLLVDSYPSSKKSAAALFMKGFVFQNGLGDDAAAKAAYSEFIKLFPDHPLVPSANAALDQLNSGMTDEELVRMFMQREAQQDSAQ